MTHTPATLLPGPEGLAWLVYESPDFRLVFDQREGFARPEAIAALLWPDTDMHDVTPDLGWESPVAHIRALLDEQICDRIGGILRLGERYYAMRPRGERPAWLPRWPYSQATIEERP